MDSLKTIIKGTGCYIPTRVITNDDFALNQFLDQNGEPYEGTHDEIAEKFTAITGISERRYVTDDLTASDIGAIAAEAAIKDAAINREEIDYIIVAHNYGDVQKNTIQTDTVPSLAARVKQQLGIVNPGCVAFDILFGCPGWVQGMIIADSFIKSGLAKRCLVIGAETLSRVIDMHDRDSMIYADGAGATIVEGIVSDKEEGILAISNVTYAQDEAYYIYMGKSFENEADPTVRYIKMYGRKIYEFALTHVPPAMKACLDKTGYGIEEVKKVFIHQANEKMDEEILKRFYRMFRVKNVPENIMPMSIHRLGNSSVATVPTLLDQVRKGTSAQEHELHKGDLILLASVGAGMNVNCIAYRL
jgi:3-oxoacyl-[acyl-carrier-protein] synthase-3